MNSSNKEIKRVCNKFYPRIPNTVKDIYNCLIKNNYPISKLPKVLSKSIKMDHNVKIFIEGNMSTESCPTQIYDTAIVYTL